MERVGEETSALQDYEIRSLNGYRVTCNVADVPPQAGSGVSVLAAGRL